MIDVNLSTSGLEIRNVTLERGGIRLIEGLSAQTGPGGALILIGRNGVGKTTLLRALAGVLRPTKGKILFKGQPVTDGDISRISLLAHANGLKPDETPRQSLEFWASISGSANPDVKGALQAMGLEAIADRPARRLSQGQKRRAAIARLALSNALLWLLDEPAAPLDATGRGQLADLVATHRAHNGLVVAATHQSLDWPDADERELTR